MCHAPAAEVTVHVPLQNHAQNNSLKNVEIQKAAYGGHTPFVVNAHRVQTDVRFSIRCNPQSTDHILTIAAADTYAAPSNTGYDAKMTAPAVHAQFLLDLAQGGVPVHGAEPFLPCEAAFCSTASRLYENQPLTVHAAKKSPEPLDLTVLPDTVAAYAAAPLSLDCPKPK